MTVRRRSASVMPAYMQRRLHSVLSAYERNQQRAGTKRLIQLADDRYG